MDSQFDGTTLIPKDGGTPEDHNKALLDLLGKINEVAKNAASDSSVAGDTSTLGGKVTMLSKGAKYGLDILYVSSDTLTVKPGMAEVSGALAAISSAFSITNTMANFPATGAWAYVTIEAGGTIRLFPATGAATVRPSDNCYQLTGGGVGYEDLGKFGYYYDAKRRIIGAIHRAGATSWYIISNGARLAEAGTNQNGGWDRTEVRAQKIRTSGTTTAPAASSKDFPVPFLAIPDGAASPTGAVARHWSFTAISVSAFTLTMYNTAEVIIATPYTLLFEGIF